MSFSKTFGAQIVGISGELIRAEADSAPGAPPSFSIVGLADKAVSEARERVSSSLGNAGISPPGRRNLKVTVSLAPADRPKSGGQLDLAIAIAWLGAVGEIPADQSNRLFIGELTLSGEISAVRGALPIALLAKQSGLKEVFVPQENISEASVVADLACYPVKNLKELILHLKNKTLIKQSEHKSLPEINHPDIGFDFIRGQTSAKRAVEVAVAGNHNLSLFGPPGTGKTSLARACLSIAPPLSSEESAEIARVASATGNWTGFVSRPFRSPHHSASYAAVVGGGINLRPGEATLAHLGFLFLDELPEFDRRTIDALRQPMEDGVVRVSRATGNAEFPSRFMFIAAMNPCPCGLSGTEQICKCPSGVALKYQRKISGPIADRIDIWVNVPSISAKEITNNNSQEKTKDIRDRVSKAVVRQRERAISLNVPLINSSNSRLPESALRITPWKKEAMEILTKSADKLKLSGRAIVRTMRVARTIADLENKEEVLEAHTLEALRYRERITNF